jgi:hypothetical protein
MITTDIIYPSQAKRGGSLKTETLNPDSNRLRWSIGATGHELESLSPVQAMENY